MKKETVFSLVKCVDGVISGEKAFGVGVMEIGVGRKYVLNGNGGENTEL